MAQVTAKLNYFRMAPRKMRAVGNLIKGMDYEAAKEVLDSLPRRSARPLLRLLESAASNGYNNLNLVKENLYIKDVIINEGMKLKRFRPKGFGMAALIQKKTSHVTLVLDERVKGMVRKEEKKAEEKPAPTPEPQEAEEKEKQVKQPEVRKELGRKESFLGGLKRKMFRRKSI